jgi:cytoskeleton protein RodZ
MPEEREKKRRKSSSGGDRGGAHHERGSEKSGNGRHAAEKHVAEPQDLKSGELLRRARLERGLELEEVSAAIHVRAGQLRALEDGHVDSLPGMTYALGFLKSYAQFLKLDPGTVINKFKAEHNMAPPKPALKFPEPIAERKMPDPVMLGVAAAAVVVCAIAWTMYSGSEEKIAAATSAIPPPPDVTALTTPAPEAGAGTTPGAPAATTAAGQANPAAVTPETNPAVAVPPPAEPAPATAVAADQAAAAATGTAPTGTPADAKSTQKSSVVWDAPRPRQRPKPGAPAAPALAQTPPVQAPAVLKPVQKPPAAAAPQAAVQNAAQNPVQAAADAHKNDVAAAKQAEADDESDNEDDNDAKAGDGQAGDDKTANKTSENNQTGSNGQVLASAAAVPPPGGKNDVIKVHRGKSRVMLQAKQDSWVQVTDQSHRVVFKQVLHPGQKYFVPDEPGMSLITSNAGGFDVFVDGSQVQPIGRAGDIVRGVPLSPDTLSVQRIRVRSHEED